MLLASPAELQDRAERLAEMIRKAVESVNVEVVSSESQVGGGSLPLTTFGSFAVAVVPRDEDVVNLTERLRVGRPAVLGRVVQDRLWLDVRTLLGDEQLPILVKALGDAASSADT
jgi:L-seryl-tRNA(Ser) seleniumtransferase